MRKGILACLGSTLLFLAFSHFSPAVAEPAPETQASAQASVAFLSRIMDQFHDRVPVYDDVSSGGNHFVAFGAIPDETAAVSVNGSWDVSPHSGATALRFDFEDVAGANFGGFYLLNGVLPAGASAPLPNFGDVPDAGVDLTGAVTLSLWARGEAGGEEIELFVAGVGRDAGTGVPVTLFPGSSPRHPSPGTRTVLSTQWQQFEIDVSGLDLSYVLGGFGWVADDSHNPGGATFYLDDIEYRLGAAARNVRLSEPRFLASYVTLPVQPDPSDGNPDDDFDLVLRNMAFSYDNALALLAFLADGNPDSLRRARLLGDAFVYAAEHDRFFDDGRIRNGYAAGDLALPPGWTPNGRVGTAAIPGFFDETGTQFFETGQDSVDVGNNAWVMIALLGLHRVTGDLRYRAAAERVGAFIRTFRNESGAFQGFQGGVDNPEDASPSLRPWASAEHNLDVFAAFRAMARVSGDAAWNADAEHARAFLEAVWDGGIGCYRAGTLDPSTLNTVPGQLPLDAQTWAALSLPEALVLHPSLLACTETHHRTLDAGFSGFDFNEDNDGVWFEGTAQAALAAFFDGSEATAGSLRAALRLAQVAPPFGDGEGIVAATVDGLSTGFGFQYFRRPHVAVAAWNVFAQLGLNPFYQIRRDVFADGFESGDTSSWGSGAP